MLSRERIGHTSNARESTFQLFDGIPRVRNLFSAALAPRRFAETTLSNQTLRENTTNEVERSYKLTESQRDHAHAQLERLGAKKTVTVIDATWFNIGATCAALSTEEDRSRCTNLEVRIRSKTKENGEVLWYWTIKDTSNPDGITRPETEVRVGSEAEAREQLAEALMLHLALTTPPLLDTVRLTVSKKRTTFRFDPRPDGEPPRPCTEVQFDFDEWTSLQGTKLEPPVLTVDVEGNTNIQIEKCGDCIVPTLIAPESISFGVEWSMDDILKERNLPAAKK